MNAAVAPLQLMKNTLAHLRSATKKKKNIHSPVIDVVSANRFENTGGRKLTATKFPADIELLDHALSKIDAKSLPIERTSKRADCRINESLFSETR